MAENVLDVASQELTPEQVSNISTLHDVISGSSSTITRKRNKQLVRDHYKIGRNEPCPCGSGKKYKNCCLKTQEYEGLHTV